MKKGVSTELRQKKNTVNTHDKTKAITNTS